MERLLAVCVAVVALAPWSVRAAGPATEDPWKGKHREEVVSLLGEPTKHRVSKHGETLFYSFVRVDPAAPPDDGALLLYVPGVGLVAKVLDVRGPLVAVPGGPLDTDEQGRPLGGGAAPPETVTVTRNLETGEVRWLPAEDPGAPLMVGKVKLRFDLDREGRVARWSASPKR